MKTLGNLPQDYVTLVPTLDPPYLAALTTSSKLMLPLCLMFFTFFLSLWGSFRALIRRAAAEGQTAI